MHCITIQLPTHVTSFVLSVGVCSKHASHCGADACLALVRRRLNCLCWRGECIIQMWLTLWGGRGRGGDVLKVEGLMMMPVRKLSALTSPAGCFPKHISALHLPHALASSGRPGQSSASWSGVVGSNFFLKMRILRMRDEVFAIGLKRALME